MSFWDPEKRCGTDGSSFPRQARTYVLAIGTSHYERLPPISRAGLPPPPDPENVFQLTQVESPAISAFSVADWFYREYNNPLAPLGGIWLLLSPSDKELNNSANMAAASQQAGRANVNNVRADLGAWKRACQQHPGSIAILYAGGHGVILSQDDSFVLLEDYMNQLRPLDGALDIGDIKKGMMGETMARTQLYFADACRLRATPKFEGLGYGIGLGAPIEGTDKRSLVVFFSATPYEAAQARRGVGTLFCQALLDCLKGLALTKPDRADPRWRITTDSLSSNLTNRLAELALAAKTEQSMAHNSQGQSAVLHVPLNPPQVDLTITVTPAPAVTKTWIELWTGNRRTAVQSRQAPPAHPFVVKQLTPGLYSLDIRFDPPVAAPFCDRIGIAVDAQPPPAIDWPVEFP